MILRTGLVLFLMCVEVGVSRAQFETGQFQKDLQTICDVQSRALGTPGYERAVDYLKQQIGAMANVELQVHEYPVMAPVTESATITLGGERTSNVYSFWPAQVRLNSTP